MASEEAMIVAGIGCGRGTLSEDIVNLILTVLRVSGIARETRCDRDGSVEGG